MLYLQPVLQNMIQPDTSVFPSGNTIGSIGSTRCKQTSNSIIRTEKFDLTTSQVIIIFLLFTMMKLSRIYLLGKLVLQSSYLKAKKFIFSVCLKPVQLKTCPKFPILPILSDRILVILFLVWYFFFEEAYKALFRVFILIN